MAIKIVEDGPEIVLTRSGHERLLREYQRATSYSVDPPSFEQFVRNQQRAVITSLQDLASGLSIRSATTK